MISTTITFTFVRETKGALRYDEVTDGGDYVVGGLYIRKAANKGDVPQTLTVTVEGK